MTDGEVQKKILELRSTWKKNGVKFTYQIDNNDPTEVEINLEYKTKEDREAANKLFEDHNVSDIYKVQSTLSATKDGYVNLEQLTKFVEADYPKK